jgi:hypothetical protein
VHDPFALEVHHPVELDHPPRPRGRRWGRGCSPGRAGGWAGCASVVAAGVDGDDGDRRVRAAAHVREHRVGVAGDRRGGESRWPELRAGPAHTRWRPWPTC